MKKWSKEFPKKEGWYWIVIGDADPVPVKIEQHPLFLRPNDPVSLVITSFNGKEGCRLNSKDAYFFPIDKVIPPLKSKEFNMSASKVSSLISLARAAESAERKYQSAFEKYYSKLKPLPEKRFWDMIRVLVREVERCVKDKHPISNAADEFYRKALTQDFRTTDGIILPVYNMEEALRFGQQYENLTTKISNYLSNRDDEFWGESHYSDDSLMDLCDMLPLSGPQVIPLLLDSKMEKFKTLTRFVAAASPDLQHSILNGEFYISNSLLNEGKQFYKASVRKD